MTEGFGGVWVSNLKDDTVVRVDPETFKVVATIPVGREPKEIVAALGSVWVVNSKSNSVTRIDPRTNRVVGSPIAVGREPDRDHRHARSDLGHQLRRRHRQRDQALRTPWTRPPSSTTRRSPDRAPARATAPDPGFLPRASMEEWDAVLAATETLRFHPGDVVLRAGERDRAFYVLLDGRLAVADTDAELAAPAVVGVAAFLDDAPRAVSAARAHRRRRGAHELGRVRGARGARPAARPGDPRRPRPRARGAAARRRTAGPGWTG